VAAPVEAAPAPAPAPASGTTDSETARQLQEYEAMKKAQGEAPASSPAPASSDPGSYTFDPVTGRIIIK
jgi:hypothetical protein